MAYTNSLNRTASWVIVELSTGEVVFETFNEALATKHLNTSKFKAVPILEWLQGLNSK
jgi:hypothetical protein